MDYKHVNFMHIFSIYLTALGVCTLTKDGRADSALIIFLDYGA